MADAFNRTTEYGGSMSADATTMTFANVTTGFIIQQVQIDYSQTVSRLYALEDGKVYFVAGQTAGRMAVNHIIGPQGLTTQFWQDYGDVCKENNAINISMQTGCGVKQDAGKLKISKPILSRIGVSANAQNMQIASNLEFAFVSLESVGGSSE